MERNAEGWSSAAKIQTSCSMHLLGFREKGSQPSMIHRDWFCDSVMHAPVARRPPCCLGCLGSLPSFLPPLLLGPSFLLSFTVAASLFPSLLHTLFKLDAPAGLSDAFHIHGLPACSWILGAVLQVAAVGGMQPILTDVKTPDNFGDI